MTSTNSIFSLSLAFVSSLLLLSDPSLLSPFSLEERLQQSRSEYHWGLDQAERIRIEEEKIETILRDKLSHVNTQVNDVSDRVHQLRQLEEEFKLKDVRIQQLETECSKYETQIQLFEQLLTKHANSSTAAASSSSSSTAASVPSAASSSAGLPLPAVLATHSPAVPAPSPTPPTSQTPMVDPNAATTTVGMAAQQPHVLPPAQPAAAAAPIAPTSTTGLLDPAAVAAAAAVAASAPADASEAVVKEEDVSMTDATTSQPSAVPVTGEVAAPTNEVPPASTATGDGSASSQLASPGHDAAAVLEPLPPSAPTSVAPYVMPGHPVVGAGAPLPGILPLLPIPSSSNPSLTDLMNSIYSSTSTIANLQMALKLHEEQLESSNRQLIDRDRAMKYMQEQIERFSNLNHELNYKLKQSENLTLEERSKLEQSYKQILFAQKQKDEQATIIGGYEEKLKVFEQLLNVADVRATSAEETVAEMLAELKSTRLANQILQTSFNKLMKEYERSVREKYGAIEEAHKIAETLAASGLLPPSVSLRNQRQESTASEHANEHAIPHTSSASPRQLFATKDEPRTPTKSTSGSASSHTDDRAFGFGGINGLASPMDHVDHGTHHLPLGLHKFEYHVSSHGLASPSAASPSSHPTGLAALLASEGHGHGHDGNNGTATTATAAPGLASHYQKFNMLLSQQNKELTMKLNQMTHHNTQLQVALVKLAHRPAKPSPTYIMAATAPSSTTASSSSPSPLHLSSPPSSSVAAASSSSSSSSSSSLAGAIKVEPSVVSSSSAMEIDGSHSPAASSSSSPMRVKLPPSSPRLTSSPSLQAQQPPVPKSPLPPLHPKKPVFQEELSMI